MSEKRFVLNVGVSNFTDTVTEKEYSEYNLDEIVEKLNELSEENKLLLRRNRTIEEEIECLSEENKQLKSSDTITDLETEIMKLKEENKELRSDRDYWKTLAQPLAKTNGNIELKDEHLGWKRVDVE